VGFSFLQDLGGGAGLSDVSDGGGNGITNALENIGVNFAAGAADVGVAALSNSAGVSPYQLAATGAGLALNSSLLTRRPGSSFPIGQALGLSPNVLVLGGIVVVSLLAYAIVFRRKG
jgi:hypothetical protein